VAAGSRNVARQTPGDAVLAVPTVIAIGMGLLLFVTLFVGMPM
jgi:hypothetical protein